MGRNTIHKTATATRKAAAVRKPEKRKLKASSPNAPETKAPKTKASRQKPWTNAEIEEAFRRLA